MPVPPPDDEWGFWPAVQAELQLGALGPAGMIVAPALPFIVDVVVPAVGDAVGNLLGWPDADEDKLYELAAAWDALAALAGTAGTTADGIANAIDVAWTDFAGGMFDYSLRQFIGGDGGLAELQGAATRMAGDIRDYAISVEFTKRQIVWELAINLPIWAATFAAGPLGWAAGAAARYFIARNAASIVGKLLSQLAGRAAAVTFPRPVLLTPGKFLTQPVEKTVAEGAKKVVEEILDEETSTVLALAEMDMLGTDFANQQMELAAVAATAGVGLSHLAGHGTVPLGRFVERGLDRVNAPEVLQRQGSVLVQSFTNNAFSSSVAGEAATKILNGEFATLGNAGDYLEAIRVNGVSAGATGALRPIGSTAARDLSVPTIKLLNWKGAGFSTFDSGQGLSADAKAGAHQLASVGSTGGSTGGATGGSTAGATAGSTAAAPGGATGGATGGVTGGTASGGPGAGQQSLDTAHHQPVVADAQQTSALNRPSQPVADSQSSLADQSGTSIAGNGFNGTNANGTNADGASPEGASSDGPRPDGLGTHQSAAPTTDHQTIDHRTPARQAVIEGQAVGAQGNEVTPGQAVGGRPAIGGPGTVASPGGPGAGTVTHPVAAAAAPAGSPTATPANTSAHPAVPTHTTAASPAPATATATATATPAGPSQSGPGQSGATSDGRPRVADKDQAHAEADQPAQPLPEDRLGSPDADQARTDSADPSRPVRLSSGPSPQGAAALAASTAAVVETSDTTGPAKPNQPPRPTHTSAGPAAADTHTIDHQTVQQATAGRQTIVQQTSDQETIDSHTVDGRPDQTSQADQTPVAPLVDVVVVANRTDSDFADKAQRAFVAAINAKDETGQLTPAAVVLREKYYQNPSTGKRTGVVARRRLNSLPVADARFMAAVEGETVAVPIPVPVLNRLPTGEFVALDIIPGQQVGRQHVRFTDARLKVDKGLLNNLQQDIDVWMRSRGKSQGAIAMAARAEAVQAAWPELTAEEKAQLEQRVLAGGDGAWTPRASQAGELVGEEFARPMQHWLSSEHPQEEVQRVYMGLDGAHTFDQIYIRIHRTTRQVLGFAIIEAKSVYADVGHRLGNDQRGYEQGHPEYVKAILTEMTNRDERAAVLDTFATEPVDVPTHPDYDGPPKQTTRPVRPKVAATLHNSAQVAEHIREALANGSVDYFVVRAEIEANAGIVRPKGFAITEYDMSLGQGARPAGPAPQDAPLGGGPTAPPGGQAIQSVPEATTVRRLPAPAEPDAVHRVAGHDGATDGGQPLVEDRSPAEDDPSPVISALNPRPQSPVPPIVHVQRGQGVAGTPMPPGGGFFAGEVYSSVHQNRARWTFGQPGQPDQVVLELREVKPPPPSYDDYANPILARRRLPLDWAFGHQGTGLMPPGVVVSPQSFAQLENLVQALIVAGHVVTVTLTEVQGKDGKATLAIDVYLVHGSAGKSTRYPGRSLEDMIGALTRHPMSLAADPTQADEPTGTIDQTGTTDAHVTDKDTTGSDTTQSLTTDQHTIDKSTVDKSTVDKSTVQGNDQSQANRVPGDDDIIRGVAESLLWFSGVRRLMADWDAVERQIHAALARDDVRKAAGIRSVRRDPENPSKYLVIPMVGTTWHRPSTAPLRRRAPFEIIVGAATIDGGHPGTFSVRADGTGPATLSVSARSGDASVARTVANLLHQLAHPGRPSEPSVLRPGSGVQRNTTLSREDGGRLAEARLLNSELKPTATPRYRVWRRQDIRNEMRTLLGHMGVARGQRDRQFRLALLDKSDGPMLDKHTRGWVVNDWRTRQRVYFAKELVFGGLPAVASSIGIGVVTGSVAAAAGMALPVLAAGTLHAVAQRWIDGHRNRVKVKGYAGRLGDVAKRNPGLYGRIETDPFGMAGTPAEEIDPAKLVPKKALYWRRHLGPAVVGASVAWALAPTPFAFVAPAIYFGASAVLRPVIDRFIDERRNPPEMLRWEELMVRVATDPARYQNQVADYFEALANRLTGATETIARLARGDESPGSLPYKTMARAELAEQIPGYLRRLVPGRPDPNELDPTEVSKIINSFGESLIFGAANNFLGALPAAGVNTVLQLKGDQAFDKLVAFSLDTVENAESRALFKAMRSQAGQVGQAVELVELVEKFTESLQDDPAQAKLVHRILERFRNNSPAAPVPNNPLPDAPTPPAPTNPGLQPTGRMSFLAQTLNVVPPIVTLVVVNAVDPVLGLDPTAYRATVFAALAQLLTAPVAKWMANRESAMHWAHEMDANNELAIDRQQLADKLGALLFIQQQTQNAAQAKIDALRPGPRPLSPTNVARSVDLFFRIRPTRNDFTNYVRAAVRAARLSIGHGPGQNTRQRLQDRQDRHLALDGIEQQADRVDDLAEAVRRGDREAWAELRKARADLAAVLGTLPALKTVDPSTGRRIEGDAITRTRAAVEEARRRLQGEPASTPLRVMRLIALNRVGEVMKVLDRYLAIAEAGGSERGVKAALNELGPRINAFKALQYRAGVAGDTRLDPIPVRQEVKALLSRRQ